MPIPTERDLVVETIATELGLETLETRSLDRLDFHELAVWNIKKALERAYNAGAERACEAAGAAAPATSADELGPSGELKPEATG